MNPSPISTPECPALDLSPVTGKAEWVANLEISMEVPQTSNQIQSEADPAGLLLGL